MAQSRPSDTAQGVAAALSAYVIWGIVIVYWKWLGQVPAFEVLAHRVAWCFAFLAPIVLALGRWPAIRAALTTPRSLLALGVSAALISGNWGLFIWAVQQGRIVEAVLGYYINPLIVIALGLVLLGERLSRLRMAALALAACGVAVQAVALGEVPWIALALGTSFAIYGYVRKVVQVEALDGLFVETMLTAPFALAFLLLLESRGTLAFGHGELGTALLLAGAGPVTAVPLWLFAVGARGVTMSTMGFLQYVSPTIGLFIAVFVYREAFGVERLVGFGLIWAALLVVSLDAFRRPALVTPETL